ncbi:hypothetical protein [Halomonas sp. E14]|uniref:hypothetical protein n=1 Tax=Halomonas sp. E14 TaxID=3397245 RepID=UPI00403EB4A3
MRRILSVLVSLCLILSLSAGSTALAGLDAARDVAHAHLLTDHEQVSACGQATHASVEECQESGHCMSGAVPLAATLDVSAIAKRADSLTESQPVPPCTLDERPPRIS